MIAGELVLTFLWVAIRLFLWKKRGRIDWKREALLLLLYVDLAVLLRFTFYPMDLVDGKVQPLLFDPEKMFPLRTNLVPLVHLLRFGSRRDLLLNLVGNVAMFIPSGIILPILFPRLNGFFRTVFAGSLISLGIEILQLPFYVRATDIDDLLLNTLGVILGYGIYALFKRIIRIVRSSDRKDIYENKLV